MTHTHTPEQIAIHNTMQRSTQNLMVSARAGSAKTYTMTSGSRLLPRVPTLFCVFNKRNAEELKPLVPDHCMVKTMNGIGHTAWQKALGNKRITFKTGKLFSLLQDAAQSWTRADQDQFAAWLRVVQAARSAGFIPEGEPYASRREPGFRYQWDAAFWQDLCFAADLDYTPDVARRVSAILLQSISQAFQGVIDYDDQIYMSVYFGGQFPKFPIVIVDEAQDLSPANHIMVERSLAPGGRLIVVGDPFQSIYAFRGAASDSMERFAAKFQFEHLALTYSFRAPHQVARRQTDWVSDFKAFEANVQGSVDWWDKWSVTEIPQGSSVVLCRNNAPLFRVAIKLIANRIPCTILGNDIAKGLENTLRKCCDKKNLPRDEAHQAVEHWFNAEIEKNKDAHNKKRNLTDRAECLHAILDADGVTDVDSAVRALELMFADKAGVIQLSTIHKAKGLEWNWVMMLDSWRINKDAEDPESEDYKQEENLRYVGETRTRDVLIFADTNKCLELKDDKV